MTTHNEAHVNLSLLFAHKPDAFLIIRDQAQNLDLLLPTAKRQGNELPLKFDQIALHWITTGVII